MMISFCTLKKILVQVKFNSRHTYKHIHKNTSHQKAKVCDICMVRFFQPHIHCSPNLALNSLGQTNDCFTHKGAKNEIQVWYNLMNKDIEDLKL